MIELVAIALTFGAVLYHIGEVSIGMIVLIGCVCAICVALFLRSIQGVFFGLVVGSVIILGALTLWKADTPIPDALYGKRAFVAKVISVDRRLDRTLLVVRDKEYAQKVQISVIGKDDTLPGDTIAIRGNVVAPQDFVTDSGRIFGYQKYLASKGIVAIVNNPIFGDKTTGRFSLARVATTVRYGVADIFADYVSFPFDGVLAGMVVGYQGGLPSAVQDLFRDTGVLHILVLSGYNITLLAGFFALILKGLSFRVRSVVTVIAIVMLVLVSGAGVAAVRAGIMGSIAVFAGLSIRTYQPIRALAIAYVFFFCISPTAIFIDPGFHLSFLATLFMIVVLPKIETLFAFIPKNDHVDVREILVLALTIPIFMLPYMMYFSGTFPLVSPLANIMFALIVPFLMIAGGILIAFAWLTPLAQLIGVIVSTSGTAILWILEQSVRLPLWQTPTLRGEIVAAIYITMIGILFRKEISVYLVQYYSALRRRTN